MFFVADLPHFFSCRKVHILGSFQNIKMARTAICNLILGSSSLFLWYFLWKVKDGGRQIQPDLQVSLGNCERAQVETLAGRPLCGTKRRWQESFYLDFTSVREEKGFISLYNLNLCCLPPTRCTEEPFRNVRQHHVLGAAKRELLISISQFNPLGPVPHGAVESVICDKSYRGSHLLLGDQVFLKYFGS